MDAPKKKTAKKASAKSAPKKSTKKAAKKAPAEKKAAAKAKPKKGAKSPQAKAAAKRTNKGKGNGTKAQYEGAKRAQAHQHMDWASEIAGFKKAKKKTMEIELGSPGSAQVTKNRLDKRDDIKGVKVTTKGAWVVFTKA